MPPEPSSSPSTMSPNTALFAPYSSMQALAAPGSSSTNNKHNRGSSVRSDGDCSTQHITRGVHSVKQCAKAATTATSTIMSTATTVSPSSSSSSTGSRSCDSNSSSITYNPLITECEALKQKIRLEHPGKTTRFSLSHMRRVAIPPVVIPPTFTLAPTVVSGKCVLFTRSSWMRRKHERRLLRRIRENDVLWM